MFQIRRQNVIWLGVLAGLTALAIVAGAAVAPLLVLMLAAAAGVALLRPANVLTRNLGDAARQQVTQRVTTAPGSRVSNQAREAVSRAGSRGYIPDPHLNLLDIGLIATAEGDEGMEMRRTRTISTDDDGVRPFVVLQVAPAAADRTAKLRFEMIDQSGNPLYVHEMSIYLRDGELNILPDQHLPLMRNPQVEGAGEWDLRVFLDGELVAMHGFNLTLSDAERANRLSGRGTARRYIMSDAERSSAERGEGEARPVRRPRPPVDDDSSAPVTLEDLLRDQKNQARRQ